ncbi:hypothetical protein R2R35_15670 [Anaerocolumna sp. AGMB13020]|uniref:hypothetical protein n=1 Tax=Anaerocolumna sp. AGMB13020 TaxID=3081750 RepID=UPI0029537299|nr:hypothetical protein [Anaerocolumna sp. AGMB13020]WOO35232.1 hypothetical protein R2R35_15670 [Anaerocolumna sp. AGMB13020]
MIIEMNQDLGVQVFLTNGAALMATSDIAVGGSDGVYNGGDLTGDMGTGMGDGAKDPLLSSWPFVIGISFLTLAVSVTIGILLAKRKIKKGIELYED